MLEKFHLKRFNRNLVVIAAGSLAVGGFVQGLLPVGKFWLGFFAVSLITFLCGIILYYAWRVVGGDRALAVLMLIMFLLRLSLGVFLAWGLPRFGYPEQPQQSGFVFYDAYRREGQAWALAQSGDSLLNAFSDDFGSDQYGGMLALSALIYRFISPDAYRPILISILAAGAMTLSLLFLTSALRRLFAPKAVLWAGWIFALYPEGVLLGSVQMREPFYILFFTILFWAATHWFARTRLKWVIPAFFLSLLGLILFSFRVAVPIVGVILLWVWLEESATTERHWLRIAGWTVIGLGVIAVILSFSFWLGAVFHWDTLQTFLHSGRVQYELSNLPKGLHFPFIMLYGVFQPVLPAALVDPAPWIWRGLGIFRATGWYAIFPLLGYALVASWRSTPKRNRRLLVLMALICVAWVLISSARAGGDQWDNPRYRTIFLPWLAALGGWGIHFAQENQDRWLSRLLIIEGIFLAFFTEWYISRYYPVIPRLNFWLMSGLIVLLSLGVIIIGWLRDRKRGKESLTGEGESL